jgi:hypothetical protein
MGRTGTQKRQWVLGLLLDNGDPLPFSLELLKEVVSYRLVTDTVLVEFVMDDKTRPILYKLKVKHMDGTSGILQLEDLVAGCKSALAKSRKLVYLAVVDCLLDLARTAGYDPDDPSLDLNQVSQPLEKTKRQILALAFSFVHDGPTIPGSKREDRHLDSEKNYRTPTALSLLVTVIEERLTVPDAQDRYICNLIGGHDDTPARNQPSKKRPKTNLFSMTSNTSVPLQNDQIQPLQPQKYGLFARRPN